MNKFFTAVFLAMTMGFGAVAQISEGGTPATGLEPISNISFQQVEIEAPSPEEIQTEDSEREKSGQPYRVGLVINGEYSPQTHGNWRVLNSGIRVWQLSIKSNGAQAIGLLYNQLRLPAGGKLFVYNRDKTQLLGAYTAFNNTEGKWSTQPIGGEEIILEYNAPEYISELPIIDIEGITYNYRGFEGLQNTGFGASDPCQVNANCAEGNNWRDQQRSVVRMYMRIGMSMAYCSGALINNARQDCTPYILSADHCAGSASANDMSQWIFHFNFEGPSCANPPSQVGINTNTVVGCENVARTNGGVQNGSDFLLVELNNTPPASYDAYYIGWTRQNLSSPSGVGIHHPSGDIKKISTYSTPTISTTLGSQPLTHWRVIWQSTASGHGVTEGGSSGSPLINSQGLVMGVLSAGLSFCSSPNEPDWYGKVSYGWQSDGNVPSERLKDWLDPDNTGINTLNGTDMPCPGIGLNESEILQNINIYPNPSTHRVYVNFENERNAEIEISVVNQMGQIVYIDVLNTRDATGEYSIDVSELPSGIYSILMKSNGHTHVKRLVVAQ